MIVGSCGFGGTGSSAIKDLLKEFDNVQVLDRAESMFAFQVDGLQDLEHHVMKQYVRETSGEVAIKRFRDASQYANVPFVKKVYLNPKKYKEDTEKFLKSITQTTYRGLQNYDYQNTNWIKSFTILAFKKFVIKYYEKYTHNIYKWWPMRDISVSIKPDNFYQSAREYMHNIIENGGGDFSKIIVLDQPFEGNNPSQSFPFFEDPYAIVIDRDPRDLYMISSYQWCAEPFLPRRDVEAFCVYYKKQRENIDYKQDNERVLRLRLEEMIFDYDEMIKKVYDFLGFNPAKHINKQKYFKPNVSIRGTQLYKKIPGHDSEIKYNEEHLKEYLFDFDSYEMSKQNTELTKNFNWQSEDDKQ